MSLAKDLIHLQVILCAGARAHPDFEHSGSQLPPFEDDFTVVDHSAQAYGVR